MSITDQYLRSFGNKLVPLDSQTINPTLTDINLYNKSLSNSGLIEIHDIVNSPIKLTPSFTPIQSHNRHQVSLVDKNPKFSPSYPPSSHVSLFQSPPSSFGNDNSKIMTNSIDRKESPNIILYLGKYIMNTWYHSPFPAEYLVPVTTNLAFPINSNLDQFNLNSGSSSSFNPNFNSNIKNGKRNNSSNGNFNSEIKIHVCQTCLKYFRTNELLNLHISIKHSIEIKRNEIKYQLDNEMNDKDQNDKGIKI